MIGALAFAGLLLAASQPGAEETAQAKTFSCQLFHNDRDAGRGVVREDLQIVQSGSPHDSTGHWTMMWPGRPPVTAQPFDADFGSVGGSIGLRWTAADGKQKKAFISFSDIASKDGEIHFWLGLDRPSLWQPPGYVCGPKSEPSGAKS